MTSETIKMGKNPAAAGRVPPTPRPPGSPLASDTDLKTILEVIDPVSSPDVSIGHSPFPRQYPPATLGTEAAGSENFSGDDRCSGINGTARSKPALHSLRFMGVFIFLVVVAGTVAAQELQPDSHKGKEHRKTSLSAGATSTIPKGPGLASWGKNHPKLHAAEEPGAPPPPPPPPPPSGGHKKGAIQMYATPKVKTHTAKPEPERSQVR